MSETRLRLGLEPDPENVIIARAFAGSVLRVVDLPPAFIDDVRLAISELITLVVGTGRTDDVTVEVTAGVDEVTLTITAGKLPPLPDETLALLTNTLGDRFLSTTQAWVLTVPYGN